MMKACKLFCSPINSMHEHFWPFYTPFLQKFAKKQQQTNILGNINIQSSLSDTLTGANRVHCRVSEFISAIHSAVQCKSTKHMCLLDKTWHIRLFLNFLQFLFFYHRLTYRSSAVIFLLYSSSIRKYRPYNFLFHFHTISWYLECNCDVTSGYIQSIYCKFLKIFFLFFPVNNKY